MSDKIKKIGKLSHAESFLQLNTIKGYEYIDRAGRIVNEYHTPEDNPPEFIMSLEGLVIRNPKPKIIELKVSSNSIWLHFLKPDSLDLILANTTPEFKKIIDVLNIKELKRIGWRNYFVYEAENKEEIDKIFLKNNQIKNLKTELLGYFIEENQSLKTKFNGLLTIAKVIAKSKEGEEKYGILFDIDLFVKNTINIIDIDKILKSFREYLTSEEKFLSIVNKFIS